jgi:hypothetical protein
MMAARNGCEFTASTPSNAQLPAWLARKTGGWEVHFF